MAAERRRVNGAARFCVHRRRDASFVGQVKRVIDRRSRVDVAISIENTMSRCVRRTAGCRWRVPVATLSAIVVLACDSAHSFVTKGSYVAPTGHFTLTVSASGIVPAGADVADTSRGVARLCASGVRAHDIAFSIARPGALEYVVAESGVTGSWLRFPPDTELAAVLAQAGFTGVTRAEAREVLRVLSGALSGPKGLVMEGQTSIFASVRTDISYGADDAARMEALRPIPNCP